MGNRRAGSSRAREALQLHADANVIVDEAAASRLTMDDYYRYTFANRPQWQRFETFGG